MDIICVHVFKNIIMMCDQILKTLYVSLKKGAKSFRSSVNAIKRVTRDAFPDRLNIFAFLIIGFMLSIALGFLLLLLPVSNSSGQWGNPLVVFFTSTSAVTDTGLVLVDTSTSWTTFGQVVIMFLIQVGGLGFMLSSAFLILMAGQHAQLRDFRVADAFGATNRKEFKHLLVNTLIITAVFEACGILIIAAALEFSGAQMPWWSAVFHSISAFNNAGFDILHNGESLTGYAGQPLVLAMFAMLSFAGALGVTVFTGIFRKIQGEAFTLDTKLALSGTLALFIGGTLLIFILSWQGSSSGATGIGSVLSNALFLSVTSRTAGFTAVNLGF
jgi:trk system potassium uptake protein TrkH